MSDPSSTDAPETAATLPPDPEIILGIQSGDERALQLLLDAYWGPLVRYVSGIVGEVADPQDVVQESFVRLWERRERWTPEGSVRALLYAMARNAALDERRRSGRRDRSTAEAPTPDQPPDPADDLEGAELRAAAARAIERLPAKRQEVFRLVREHGLSYREVAELLGLSAQTVANHMSLALSDLRTSLRPFLSDPPDPRG